MMFAFTKVTNAATWHKLPPMPRLPLPLVLLLGLLGTPVFAADVKDVFVKLPASCFEEWGGEGEIPLANPAKRKALVEATGDKQKEIATEMSLRDVVIDTKNGFIKIESNGDGEGTIFTMALWNCADGSKLAGVAIEQWTNVANDTDHISFWQVQGDKLTDVTKDTLPDLTLTSFYDTRLDVVKKAQKDTFRWWWHLPQKGTTISVVAPAMDLIEEYESLTPADHAYEGRWDGKKFSWVKVKPKAVE